jgi:hypothetical protein
MSPGTRSWRRTVRDWGVVHTSERSFGDHKPEILGQRADDGTIAVGPTAGNGRTFRARTRTDTSGGLLAIEPSAVVAGPNGMPERHVNGMVEDVAFRGQGGELVIRLDRGVQVRSVGAEQRPLLGERVGVHFEPTNYDVFDSSTGSGRIEAARALNMATVESP